MGELAAATERLDGVPAPAGAAVALLVVDDDCRVAEANLAACRLLRLARDEIADHTLAEFLAPPAADRLERIWRAFHETGGHAGPFELALAGGDREPVDISVTAAVLPGRHLVLLSTSGAAEPPRDANGHPAAPLRQPTSRERQILGMLAEGDTDTQIAGKLELSPATVQTHVRNAKAKLGARTRAQAVAMAMRRGLIVPDAP